MDRHLEDALVLASQALVVVVALLILFFAGYGFGAWFNWF